MDPGGRDWSGAGPQRRETTSIERGAAKTKHWNRRLGTRNGEEAPCRSKRALSILHPYDNNPRINHIAVDAVAAPIQEFDARWPTVVDEDGGPFEAVPLPWRSA